MERTYNIPRVTGNTLAPVAFINPDIFIAATFSREVYSRWNSFTNIMSPSFYSSGIMIFLRKCHMIRVRLVKN